MKFTEIFKKRVEEVFLGDTYSLMYESKNLFVDFNIYKQYIIVSFGVIASDNFNVEFWYEPWKISEEAKKQYDDMWSKAYSSKLSVYGEDFLSKIIENQGGGLNRLTQKLIIKIFNTR